MDEQPKVKGKNGGARPGAGRKPKERLLLLEQLEKLNYNPVQNVVNDAEAARLRGDPASIAMATKIDLDLISYLVPKPRTDIKAEVTVNPLEALAKVLGERPKPNTQDIE